MKASGSGPEFRPSIHFEEGIRRTLDRVLSDPALQVEDPEFDRWCDEKLRDKCPGAFITSGNHR